MYAKGQIDVTDICGLPYFYFQVSYDLMTLKQSCKGGSKDPARESERRIYSSFVKGQSLYDCLSWDWRIFSQKSLIKQAKDDKHVVQNFANFIFVAC